MADNDLVLRIPHSLGAAEAKRRIADGVSAATAQYGRYLSAAETNWEGNNMSFSVGALAQTVRGNLEVGEDHVELRAQLPMVIRALAKRFIPIVQDTGRKLLTRKT